jgi:hypothetical protein
MVDVIFATNSGVLIPMLFVDAWRDIVMTTSSDQNHQLHSQDTDDRSKTASPTDSPHAPSPGNGHDLVSSREEHLEDRIHQVLEQKLISLLDNESTNREIIWLRRQVRWSIGFLVILIIILGGAFTWMAYLMRTNPPGQEAASSTAIAPLNTERLDALEAQIQMVGDRIPENLSTTLTTNKEQLQALSNQLNALSDDIAKNQQTLTNLETSMQSLEDSILIKENEAEEPSNSQN